MAKSNNTWQKKLMTKQKAFVMKQRLGNEKGVMSHCLRAHPVAARSLDLLTIKDKPLPTGPKEPDKRPLPRCDGHMVRGFRRRKLSSGCVMSPEKRALMMQVKAAKAAREKVFLDEVRRMGACL